ncbi:MAG: CoA transferase [Rhodospirillales bacterium]|nr:CoA transferase [Rhodospirillales bacterium]
MVTNARSGFRPVALAGIRVIDLSRILSGPYCTQWLADHGADVIKIEPPQGDETRTWGPPFRDGTASYFIGINRNKRGIALDLSQPMGRDVLLALLTNADVLIENFKPGTLEKWGLGYEEALRHRFPKLIHCRISGFGSEGPLGGMPGYDAIVQAMTGLMSVNGTPESGPTRIGIPLVDLGTGLNAAIGILMALVERQRSDQGQFIEISLYDTGVSLLHPQAANWFLNGRTPVPTGNQHPNIVPYDKFATKTTEIFVGVGNDRQFRRLCERLGCGELANDMRFRSNGERNINREALRAELETLLADKDGFQLCEELLRIGVPAGPVNNITEVLSHPHTRHREMVVAQGDQRGTGIPIKMSRTPGQVRQPAPNFGADTRAVLAEAGYSDADIQSLFDAGVAFEAPTK